MLNHQPSFRPYNEPTSSISPFSYPQRDTLTIKRLSDPERVEKLKVEMQGAEELLFIKREDLDFVNSLTPENHQQLYTDFLQKRFDVLKQQFYEKNKI